MTSLDWAGLLRAGLCTLRLPPATFWALTPVELQIMLGAQAGPAPMTRARLDALVQKFPDTKETDYVRP